MRRLLRWANVLAALPALASALAVLASSVADAGYRAHYGDSIVMVVLYAAFYAAAAVAFARDDRRLPHLALLKTAGALLFLVTFVRVGPLWMAVTPGRYVYLLFDWGPEARVVLMAYVILGRGVWNVLNAMYFTAPWWMPLRQRRPLLGRVVTILPLGLAVALVAALFQLVEMDRATFSSEAHAVARVVFESIDCEELRAKQGTETTDLRQRGDRRYRVHVRWDCRALHVVVQDPDGRLGEYLGPRSECCDGAQP